MERWSRWRDRHEALSDKALNRGVALFLLPKIPHPITPPSLHLALATKVEGWLRVVEAETVDTHTHTHTPKHTFPSRQAVTASLERRDEVPVHQM